LPVADRGVERVELADPMHPITGDSYEGFYNSDDENRDYLRSQQPIRTCRETVKAVKNGESCPPTTVAVHELTLYLPSEIPHNDMAGDVAGRVDLSLCLAFDSGLHLQILFEAKANQESAQQRGAVAHWGDKLDQPLRYAAAWEEFEGSRDEEECRILATIEMSSYRERWLELWKEVRVPRTAQMSQYKPRVAMADDLQWVALKQLVASRPECAALARLMLG
jgi:hypothetical protein